jgi:hypothetical protein
MNTTANKKIAFAALAAPVLAAIAVGLAAPAWASSEQVEPSEPSEVSEVGLPTMPSEQQEQTGPSTNIFHQRANNVTPHQCSATSIPNGTDPAQVPALHNGYVDAFC